jgi:hypothetical protein
LGFILTLSHYLAGLLENPAIPVGMVCWFVRGAMYLAWSVEDLVKLAWSISVPFKGLPFLPGPRSAEPCIYCGVLGVAPAIFMPALVFIALGLAISVASL